MSKKPAPSYAPMYAALYPALAELFQRHGYALAIHGSMQRDFDLVAIPWTDTPSEPESIIGEIIHKYDIHKIGELTPKLHGRLCQTISIGHGCCALDLSFMPANQLARLLPHIEVLPGIMDGDDAE